MCPPNTPYSGGFWASCPLRHPDVSFWVGPTLRRGGARQVGTPLGLLCWGPRPLTSSCCGGHLPFVLKCPVVGGCSGDWGTWKMGTALPWWVGVQEACGGGRTIWASPFLPAQPFLSPWLGLDSQRAPSSPGSRLWAQPCWPLCQRL